MKHNRLLVFLIPLLWIPAAHCGTVSTPVPTATCIPADHPEWPVQGIYLHGWFAANGSSDVSGYRALELANRQAIEKLAAHFHRRIALPIAPKVNASGMRTWSGTSLGKLESLAEKACGGAALAPDRSLIGFSNGGFEAHDIGSLSCNQLSNYKRILAVGTQTGFASRCNGKFKNISPHVFPPANLDGLSGLGGSQSAVTDDENLSDTPVK